MTLVVRAYHVTRDAEGERIVPLPYESDLAGFEATRTTFYGSARAHTLGLGMLASLATSGLHVRGGQLGRLREEVSLLMANLTPAEISYWQYRLTNILHAIDAASVHGPDGLVIIE